MNYLEWKKRILIYMVARGKPIDVIPEELDFYLYSKFKAVNIKSLPGQMAIAFPMGLSVEKAVDCLSQAISKTGLDLLLNDNVIAAEPGALAVTDLQYIAEVDCKTVVLDSFSLASEQVRTQVIAELQAEGCDCKADIAKFDIKDSELGITATVCLDTTNSGAMHVLALTAASALITTIAPTEITSDVELGDVVRIGVTPGETFMAELVSGIDIDVDSAIDLSVDSIEPIEPEGTTVELPGDEIAVTAELIRMAQAETNVDTNFGLGVKVACLKRAVVADYTGEAIASLEGRSIESLMYIEI